LLVHNPKSNVLPLLFDCRVLHTIVYCEAVRSAILATAWRLVCHLCDVRCSHQWIIGLWGCSWRCCDRYSVALLELVRSMLSVDASSRPDISRVINQLNHMLSESSSVDNHVC